MANRRFGGPSNKGGGGFGQQNFGNKLNPWQGGAGPNTNMNGGLLSQLSAPQAQLALALSSLLQPQQQGSGNPPSLLSLSTSPSFGNQDNFGSQNRYNNRGRDFRRPEPYNKLVQPRTGPWRDNSTRPSDSYGGKPQNRNNFPRYNLINRKPPIKGAKPIQNKQQNKPAIATAKVNESSVTVKEDVVSIENRDEEALETDAEKKRDWKKEKNTEDESEANESADISVEDQKKGKKLREGRYQGVQTSLLHCFVCNKSMWDGESFQNHLRGKAHKQMMDSLGQSFQITVNILRENMRLVEEKKMIELERMSRNNRSFHRQNQEPQSHCNMCDLKFLGKIINHRKTEGHQRLKRFLHPKCQFCSQEFPSRMEWVDHRFTPDHLIKVQEVLKNKVKGEDGAPPEEEVPEMDNDPLLDESLQTEDENPILELSDDLKDLQNRLPAYKRSRPVSTQSVKPVEGFYCSICVRYMTTEDAAQAHLRTERHYNVFIETAKKQYKRQSEEEKATEERLAKKRKAEEETDDSKKAKVDGDVDLADVKVENGDDASGGNEMYDPEEACKDNDNPLDNTTLEEEFEEVDRLIKSANEEEQQEAAKEKAAAPPEVVSPRARRAAAAAPVATGGVRNGAGPRSKTRRGGKI